MNQKKKKEGKGRIVSFTNEKRNGGVCQNTVISESHRRPKN